MPIVLSKNYVPLLDEVYESASLTGDLNSSPAMVKAGNNANEICIPKLKMSGLGNYSRNSGYTKGKVDLTWETVKFNYDRGTKFEVDTLDNEETAEVAFGMLGAEFERTKVAPEGDAFVFAQLAGTPEISVATGTIEDGENAVKALRTASVKMDNDKVPKNQRLLYITSEIKGYIDDLDTTKSRNVLSKFEKIIEVPQSVFYTQIVLNDIEDTEEGLDGGYDKATEGKDINFMIVHKPAVIKHKKHVAKNIITPDENQSSDAYMQKYRKYGLVDVYENKRAGVYLHHKAE